MGRLIIDGNDVYEIDEKCINSHKINKSCGVIEKLKEYEKSLGKNISSVNNDKIGKISNSMNTN